MNSEGFLLQKINSKAISKREQVVALIPS